MIVLTFSIISFPFVVVVNYTWLQLEKTHNAFWISALEREYGLSIWVILAAFVPFGSAVKLIARIRG